VAKRALPFSTEVGHQMVDRVRAGQIAEDMAAQSGRTPKTGRTWLTIATGAGQKPAALLRQPALHERAMAFGRELVASLSSWREAQYAAQVSRDMLKLYQIVSASHPGLPRRAIYKKVVMARTGSDLNEAEAVLSWAEQSFASWPTERALTFSDVVHYMAVSEYLAVDDRMATRINMGRLVAGRIPEDL
jgi:hypothetical protein